MAALVRWEPYREMVSLSDVMDRLFSNALVRPLNFTGYWDGTQAMPVDVAENAESYTVKASVPGIQPEDLNITIENNVLTISAEQKAEDSKDGHQIRWQERSYGKMERCFTLPVEVDANKAEAKLEHGVLTLSVPKAEAVKPKTIKVQAK